MSEQLGRYTLERKLAVGGMAEVFLARQSGPEGFEKVCVVKRMLPALADDENFVRMFLNEARLAAQLNHPNIAQIYDFGAVNETFYLAMEYVQGSNLRTIVKQFAKRGACVPVPVAARIASHAALALDYAHNATTQEGAELGIIHRDVSPQNILLGQAGTVKLIDFGVAKATIATHHTKTGLIKGKYAYMSPEQLRAQPLDPRSDLFALGLVLYELLAPGRAIKGSSDLELMENAIKMNFEPLDTLRPDLPTGIRNIVRKALQRDRDARYGSAHEMSEALEMFIAQQGEVVTGADLQRLLDDKGGSSAALGALRVVSSDKHLIKEDGDNSTTGAPATRALASPSQEPTRNMPPPKKRRREKPPEVTAGTDPSVPAELSVERPTGRSRSLSTTLILARRRLAVLVGFAFGLSVALGGWLRGCVDPSAGPSTELADEVQPAPALPVRVAEPAPAPTPAPAPAAAPAPATPPPAPISEQPHPESPAVAPTLVQAEPSVATSEPLAARTETPVAKTEAPAAKAEPPKAEPPAVKPTTTVAKALPLPTPPPPPPPKPARKPPRPPKRFVAERAPVEKAPAEPPPAPPQRPDPPPPNERAERRKGTITFSSLPPTDIWVDGAPKGRSPLTIELSAGEHTASFRDERAGLRHQSTFVVVEGEARTEKWQPDKGKVSIRAVPYAEVVMGEKALGLTPMPPLELYEGVYKFVFSNKATGKNEVRTVTVKAGEESIIKVDLRAEQ